MISVKQLIFDYPDKRALHNVSFNLKEGTITALVGPNGSGKTTLLRSMAALSKPLSGEIIINGFNVFTHPREVHLQVGYLQDLFGLYDQLTVTQSMQFTAYSRLKPGSPQDMEAAISLASSRAGIGNFMHKKLGALSRGMRQRVGIAQAIIHQPKVLLLDEPASGLDPEARYALSHLLLELCKSGMTIIVSSHILAELEDYSTEMLVIQDGRMIEHRTLKADPGHINIVKLELKFGAPADQYVDFLFSFEGVQEIRINGNTIHLEIDEQYISKQLLLKRIVAQDLPLEEFSEIKMNLQDEYIKTVSNYKQSRA